MAVQIQRGLEIVPGYTLVRRVGSGMAGEVWVARASGGVHVAIKVIRDMSMVGSKRELGALRIVREVKHTNLCPLIGVWFFDANGELLSNSATDEILGQESSLIDTDFLSTQHPLSGDLRETPAVRLGPNRSESKEDRFDAHSTVGPDENDITGGELEETSDISGYQSFRGPADDNGTEESSSPLGEARQMVVAMGLGDRTLFDRLVEMRAPDNQPTQPDPLHLPGGIHAKELIRYIAGAASAIDELNLKHNIYHCDIKPQNILVVGGNAQVCDFGLARRVHENRRTQLAIGTPAYGAPEMLFDQTYTKTIDQYSLAITYYELRTGKLPFETTRRSTFLRAKAQGELLLNLLPAAEEAVIARASDLDPERRYPTCTDFAEALAAAIDAKPDEPKHDPKRWMIAGISSGIVALVVASWAIMNFGNNGNDLVDNGTFKDLPDLPAEIVEAVQPTEAAAMDSDTTIEPTIGKGPTASDKQPSGEPMTVVEPATSLTPSPPPPPPPPTLDDFIAEANDQATQLIERFGELGGTANGQALSKSVMTEMQSWLDQLAQVRELPPLRDGVSASLPDPLQSSVLQSGLPATGWDLLDRSTRIPATFIAGVLAWDSGRSSNALELWYSIQNENELISLIDPTHRRGVVERVLPRLIQGTGVNDSNTKQHRYARSTASYQGVLNLLADFSVDVAEMRRQVDGQRFLLSAAKKDPESGLKLWRSLRLNEQETTPQAGFALAGLVDVRLAQSPPKEERGNLITERIVACQLQDPLTNQDSVPPSDQTVANYNLLRSEIEFPDDGLPIVPDALANSTVEDFCVRFAGALVGLPAAKGHDVFLARLQDIERVAGIALALSDEDSRQEAMRLIAAESFLQTRYEQNDDVPPTRIIERLRAYGGSESSDSVNDVFVNSRIADQNGYLARDEKQIRSSYQRAQELYGRVVDDPKTPADLRASALRCRANLLTRIAAISNDETIVSLLDQAAADSEQSLSLPSRWHLDNDDRLMTAAEVNLAMVRLIDSLSVQRKQDFLDDADQYLAQSIAERDRRGYPSHPHATARLNGYLLDLIDSPPGPRRDQKSLDARRWMQANATAPLNPPVGDITMTINTTSSRLRCHWHCMCSMVLSELNAKSSALAQIQYAYQVGQEQLDVGDDRRHLATLVLTRLKSTALYASIAAGRKPDADLIDELIELLNSIEDPKPDYRAKQELFLNDLQAMKR
ncbi:protein kinase domain-containing protein [Neorhodopirellula pilleata]|uniref:Serine/threonine-protein kinase PknF n=1 Tax=Neorhodopirellula pilleata TaxID=2714738 RepID=A0A5C6AUX8_9BACT|nr:protein kinase [Neorhodopirellula pilleata]TWU03540.1 Serine/threonine-protein kinase PknF [Neorhodopirellula pilleata]